MKNKTTFVLTNFYILCLSVMFFVSCKDSDVSEEFLDFDNIADYDGNGLIDIYNADDLNNIRYNPAGTSYKKSDTDPGIKVGCPNDVCFGYELKKDIDLATSAYASHFVPIAGFNSVFEGNYHRINNLKINQPTVNFAALFTNLLGSDNLVIRNLRINNANIIGSRYVAALAGIGRNGNFENIIVDSAVIEGVEYVGGIFGAYFSSGSVNSLQNSRVQASNITASNGSVGGIFATTSSSAPAIIFLLQNIRSLSNIITGGTYAGGFIGYVASSSNVTIKNSGNSSTIYGSKYIGGLVGKNSYILDISNSFNLGNLYPATDNVESGGIIGSADTSSTNIITNSYNRGIIGNIAHVTQTAGGIIGRIAGSGAGTFNIDHVYSANSFINKTGCGSLIGSSTVTFSSINGAYMTNYGCTQPIGGVATLNGSTGYTSPFYGTTASTALSTQYIYETGQWPKLKNSVTGLLQTEQ